PADSPVTSTAPRSFLTSVNDAPFDVESDTDYSSRSPYQPDEAQEELLDVLHARRGQRLGVDEESDDELAAMITRDEDPDPLQGPKLVVSDEFADGSTANTEPETENLTTEVEVAWSDDNAEDPANWDGGEVVAGEFMPPESSDEEHHEGSYEQVTAPADTSDNPETNETDEAEKKTDQPGRSRKRPTVPSWDEII